MTKSIAWLDDVQHINVYLEEDISTEQSEPFIRWEDEKVPAQPEHSTDSVVLSFDQELPLEKELVIEWGEMQIPLYPRNIVRTSWFEEKYDASNEKLGAHCTEENSYFAVWSPTASSVRLHLNEHTHNMERKENGVWTVELDGDWNGALYDYEVQLNGSIERVNDPYAKSMTANSERGVLINHDKVGPAGFHDYKKPVIAHAKDAIIYELHVRDATISEESGVVNKGKFLGLTEKNTTTSNGFSTGLSYIKELGVTHVQILPINDFARVNELEPDSSYNWGYDPLYFHAPEGSYSSDPSDPLSRVAECKQMIQSFHEEGLSVILDVVYNHVFDFESSSFEKLVPGYYFRFHPDGTLSNGTGTGNDIASERKMARKFILDSIKYWLTEYRVNGFRFDLMGILDVDTIQLIREYCDSLDETILLLGEGWDMDTPIPAEQKSTIFQSFRLNRVSFFNDLFRDTIKGSLFGLEEPGYANGDGNFVERLPAVVSGSCLEHMGEKRVLKSSQSVNFVEVHDNRTLWDHFLLTNPDATEDERKKMHQLATGLVFLSQGISFLHAGQEFFRTKQGDENSYISGDEINQLDWKKREEEDENVQWIRTLIQLRKEFEHLRLRRPSEIKLRLHILITPEPVFGFTILGEKEDLVIYANPMNQSFRMPFPSHGMWTKLTSNYHGGISPISCLIGQEIEIQPYEIFVMTKPRVKA